MKVTEMTTTRGRDQFYPTPPALAEKMLAGLDMMYVHSVLEPSAGKGDLIDAIGRKNLAMYQHDRAIEVDFCEIDPYLRQICKYNFSEEKKSEIYEKYRPLQQRSYSALSESEKREHRRLDRELDLFRKTKVYCVHDDFLTYRTYKHYDLILMNPPYGGNEKNEVKRHFPADLSSSETADLFMVVIQYRLKARGRAAVILPDGFLFGTDNAKLAIKEKLLREFNLHTIIRLPGSIFAPYTSIATNILFFNNEKAEGAAEGFSTKETWFYRLDMPEGYKHFSKTKPMQAAHCQPIKDWWQNRVEMIDAESGDEKSRRFSAQELMDFGLNFDQCKFPKEEEEVLRPEELLKQYHEKRTALDAKIDQTLSEIQKILGIDIKIED